MASRPLLERVVLALAAIAVIAFGVQQYTMRRQHGQLDRMRSALRRLALAQDSWRYDHGVYAADVQLLGERGYATPAGVEVAINEATIRGWSATASHTGTRARCFLYVGDAAPVALANRMGSVRCG